MKTVQKLGLSLLAVFGATRVSAADVAAPKVEYGIHLFFDEKEYIDVLTLEKDAQGHVIGKMHVPNDFDADIQNLKITDLKVNFDLLVPKNNSRPTDLLFHYHGNFFAADHKQVTGFVTIQDKNDFVASFVAFQR